MPLGSNDVKSAAFFDFNRLVLWIFHHRWLRLGDTRAEFDVGTAAGHVRGDWDCTRLARVRNDIGFALMILGVEDVVRNSRTLEHARKRLRYVDAHRSNEHRVAELVKALGLLENRVVFLTPGLVDQVVTIVANYIAVCRNYGNTESVDLVELSLFRFCGTGHSRKLRVHAEIVLDGDGRHGLRLTLHLNSFLCLNCLMQSYRPSASRHGAPRELIDDEHLAFLHHVIHVDLVQGMRAQQLMHDVQSLTLRGILTIDRIARLEL